MSRGNKRGRKWADKNNTMTVTSVDTVAKTITISSNTIVKGPPIHKYSDSTSQQLNALFKSVYAQQVVLAIPKILVPIAKPKK